jgi:uncharacterized membrane protein
LALCAWIGSFTGADSTAYSGDMERSRVYAGAAAIGFVAGLRSMAAPAILSRSASSGLLKIAAPRLTFLNSGPTTTVTTLLALAEMIADKTPNIPNRTDPGPLAVRFISGGICGAALCSARHQRIAAGFALGGLAAVAGAYIGFELRKRAAQHHLPNIAVALAEDAIAVGTGLSAMSSFA